MRDKPLRSADMLSLTRAVPESPVDRSRADVVVVDPGMLRRVSNVWMKTVYKRRGRLRCEVN